MVPSLRVPLSVAAASAVLALGIDRRLAHAQPVPAAGSAPAESAAPPWTLGGYAEAYYQWNFAQPSNGITNARGFDNRHDSFTISNVALDAQWDAKNVVGRAAIQLGHTPSTYYLAEPSLGGSGAANASGPELWKYLQQAYAGYRFDGGVLVTAGLFLSPIGPEGIAVKDNWNWSRSNLFFGLPFYHTGVRVAVPVDDVWTITLAAYNGWNSVVDNNDEKSAAMQVAYALPDRLTVGVVYFSGVERPTGAPEGRPWRHLLDGFVTWTATDRLSLMVHGDAGFERTRYGDSSWVAGALYGRVRVLAQVYVAARVDAFREHVASSAAGAAAPIFWPVSWVGSGTATLDYQPVDHVAFRLEYRHDHAAGDLFFAGSVTGDGAATPYVPNRDSQNTVTAGATAWF